MFSEPHWLKRYNSCLAKVATNARKFLKVTYDIYLVFRVCISRTFSSLLLFGFRFFFFKKLLKRLCLENDLETTFFSWYLKSAINLSFWKQFKRLWFALRGTTDSLNVFEMLKRHAHVDQDSREYWNDSMSIKDPRLVPFLVLSN